MGATGGCGVPASTWGTLSARGRDSHGKGLGHGEQDRRTASCQAGVGPTRGGAVMSRRDVKGCTHFCRAALGPKWGDFPPFFMALPPRGICGRLCPAGGFSSEEMAAETPPAPWCRAPCCGEAIWSSAAPKKCPPELHHPCAYKPIPSWHGEHGLALPHRPQTCPIHLLPRSRLSLTCGAAQPPGPARAQQRGGGNVAMSCGLRGHPALRSRVMPGQSRAGTAAGSSAPSLRLPLPVPPPGQPSGPHPCPTLCPVPSQA